jgi:hypothetical protein
MTERGAKTDPLNSAFLDGGLDVPHRTHCPVNHPNHPCSTQPGHPPRAAFPCRHLQVNKVAQQPSMMSVYEGSHDLQSFLSALGGLVGSQRPEVAASILNHFTTFSSFIHCHMRHLLCPPPREMSAPDTCGGQGVISEVIAVEFMTSNKESSGHQIRFPLVPEVAPRTAPHLSKSWERVTSPTEL